jgi:hypothetical protein
MTHLRADWLMLSAVLAVFALVGCGDDPGADDGATGAASSSGGGDTGNIGEDDAGGTGVDTAGTSSGGDGGTSPGVDGGASSGVDGGASSGGTSGGDATADTGEELDCPGSPGCKCENNDECDTAYCLDFPEGKKCAQLCTDTCPQGLQCKDISGGQGDKVFACTSPFVALCAPCLDDQICQHNGVKGLCIDYGVEGRFCGGPCATDDACPTDYACVDAKGVDGSESKQCKRKSDVANPVCGCSDWALNAGAKTKCGKTNAVGTCQAERKCTATGLESCKATAAKVEVCNAFDDDCNGTVDDLAIDFKCSKKLFAALGSMATCTDDSGCATTGKDGALEKCDLSATGGVGACKQLDGECFGIPSCTAAGKLLCNEAKTPIAEACDLQDNDCDGQTDETFTWKGTDDKVTGMGQPCGFGECAGGNVVCETLTSAVCDTAKKSKDEKCDGVDNDCNGTTDDAGAVCDDNDACTSDKCDGKTGDCTNPASVDCDDKNPCTSDSCDKKKGVCVNTLTQAASCDDGNACSVGDTCGKGADGGAACLPGATTKVCDDANLCTDDACDPKTGCTGLPNAATQACYSGAVGTQGKGECSGGQKFCKDGAQQGVCVGEVTPNNTEICDNKDDDCNGTVDNGCVANIVHVRTATVAGTVKSSDSKGKQVRMRMGGESSVYGVAKGTKTTGYFGWYAWILSFGK